MLMASDHKLKTETRWIDLQEEEGNWFCLEWSKWVICYKLFSVARMSISGYLQVDHYFSDAPQDCDEVENIPCVSEVILEHSEKV